MKDRALPFHRALLLVNRHCRHGLTDVSGHADYLRQGGLDIDMEVFEFPEEIPLAIRDKSGECDLVILAGGDGTMNSSAEALIETRLPFAILPMGTGNDLARTLGIPLDLRAACDVILGGRLHAVDVGRVNGKLFFNVASLGLSVEVSRRLTPDYKRRWGVLAYALASYQAIRNARPFRAEIRCDGQAVRLKTVQIAVGNGRHYGGGMTVDEEATLDDGRLHLYSLKPRHLLQYLFMLPALRAGKQRGWPGVLTLSGRCIEVTTRRRRPINTDGELTGYTPARFDVLPAALSVVVPESYLLARQGGRDDAAGRVGSCAE